jgi:hypothetical protein
MSSSSRAYSFANATNERHARQLALTYFKPAEYDGYGIVSLCLEIGDPYDNSRMFKVHLADAATAVVDYYALAVFDPRKRRVYFIGFCDWWGITIRNAVTAIPDGARYRLVQAMVPKGCFKPEIPEWRPRVPVLSRRYELKCTLELDWYMAPASCVLEPARHLTSDERRELARKRYLLLQHNSGEKQLADVRLSSPHAESPDIESFVLMRMLMCKAATHGQFIDWCDAEADLLRRRLCARLRDPVLRGDAHWMLVHLHPTARLCPGLTKAQLQHHIQSLQPPVARLPVACLPKPVLTAAKFQKKMVVDNDFVTISFGALMPVLIDVIVATFRTRLHIARGEYTQQHAASAVPAPRPIRRAFVRTADEQMQADVRALHHADATSDDVADEDIEWQPVVANKP